MVDNVACELEKNVYSAAVIWGYSKNANKIKLIDTVPQVD